MARIKIMRGFWAGDRFLDRGEHTVPDAIAENLPRDAKIFDEKTETWTANAKPAEAPDAAKEKPVKAADDDKHKLFAGVRPVYKNEDESKEVSKEEVLVEITKEFSPAEWNGFSQVERRGKFEAAADKMLGVPRAPLS